MNTIEGLILCYVAGVIEEATASYSTGLIAFTFVVLFIATRIALVAVRTDGWLFEVMFCFVLAACYYGVIFGMRRLLEPALAIVTQTD